MFLHGLADRIQDEICLLELPPYLDELIDLAIRVDARLRRRGQRNLHKPITNTEDFCFAPSSDAVGHLLDPEPMQMGRARLSKAEKERRRINGLCFYCGTAGHIAAHCPVKTKARQ